MAAVTASPTVSWQERFRMGIAQDVAAAVPSPSTKELGTWILGNCRKSVKSMSQLSITKLSPDQWETLFVNAVCKTIKQVLQERLTILTELIELSTNPERFRNLLGKKTPDDYAALNNLDSWIAKMMLLEKWIKDPFLVIPKHQLMRKRSNHPTTSATTG